MNGPEVGGENAAPTATARQYEAVWRDPAEETVDLYPNAVVCDDRVSGSITFSRSRLPMWAVIGEYAANGWAGVENGWDQVAEYGWDNDKFAAFLYQLLEMRGEFGRLLLMLANAERLEADRDEAWEAANIVYKDGLGEPKRDAEDPPGPWWSQPDICGPLIEQLRSCVAALESGGAS